MKIDESTTTKMVPQYQQNILKNDQRTNSIDPGPYEQELLQGTISKNDMALSSLQIGMSNSQSEIIHKTVVKDSTSKASNLKLSYERKQTGVAEKDLVIGYEEEKAVG